MATKEYSKKWYWEHRESQILNNRKWKEENRERMLAQKKQHYLENKEKILQKKKEWRSKNQDKIKAYRRRPEVKARARIAIQEKREKTNHAYDRQRYQRLKIERPEYLREKWRRDHKNNPRSSSRYSLEVQLAMNNVRKRQHNTCQWYGCGLTNKQAPIHVHHIFPRSEYPQYETEQKYMICYCANHHHLWHRYRGDVCAKLITLTEGETSFVRGRE